MESMRNKYPIGSRAWIEYINYKKETSGRLIKIMHYFHGITEYYPAMQDLVEAFDEQKQQVRIFALANIKAIYAWGPLCYVDEGEDSGVNVVFGRKVIFVNKVTGELKIIPDVASFPTTPLFIPLNQSVTVQSSGVIVIA
jgi:hypothetical protein